MKKALLALLVFPLSVHAGWAFDNSGERMFDLRKNETSKTTITIQNVDPKHMQKECNAYSRKIGNSGVNYQPLACAFWTKNTCHIIMPHRVDMRTVGHEVMHCFQGDWHSQPNQ
jgi:hypothetical protein